MDRDANDINSIMASQSVPVEKKSGGSKLIWIVLACVVVGVVGGIVVYQQSIFKQTSVKTSARPVASKPPTVAVKPSPTPVIAVSPVASSSADPAAINIIDDWENTDPEGNGEDDDYLLSPTPSPSVRASSNLTGTSPSPSSRASTSATPRPSGSVRASSTTTGTTGTRSASPSPSSRVTMPDTEDGVPVTGVFEVTAGTMSVGILLIMIGMLGLLVL